MTNLDHAIRFADEPQDARHEPREPWTILVVDDEESVHEVTRLALADVSFEGRAMRFLGARSSAEARQRLREHPEIALVLLDVVMETETAGLDLITYIRDELANQLMRIVLRTGQPGQAPERRVVAEYDISDYKTKVELTLPRLYTTVIAALRIFRQMGELEAHRRQAVSAAEALRRFFPEDFLRLLGKHAITEVRLGDQIQRDMTVMFADIRGFTARSEDMNPAECFAFVNRVFAALCPVVRGHHGYIDKFLGDGFLALFPRAAADAVEAAVAIQRRLTGLNAGMEGAPVRLAIGLHSGAVMLGTVGESERMEATVLSDDVNVAARLAALCKAYDAGVVLSEQTRARVESAGWEMRSIGVVRLYGKHNEVAVYELIEAEPEPVRERKRATGHEFAAGLERYRDGDFAAACVHLGRVLTASPADEAARLYLQRSAEALLQAAQKHG
jgi:adenylate cyclase